MSDKTPLILVPGLLCDAALWRAQIEELADIADAIVADTTQDDSLDGMAARILADAPETFALAGLSMGGYCAQAVMRQAPERVSRLALLDTSAEADTPARTQIRLDWIAKAEAEGLDAVIPWHMESYFHPEHLKDRDMVAIAEASARTIGLEAYKRQQTAIAGRTDNHTQLAKIDCPTLLLCGRQDMATPLALHERMAAVIPGDGRGAELTVIDDCGHLSPLERPAEVSAALRQWLTN